MIESSEKRFDYSSFEKKLKHYFSDTAPCVVRYSLGLSDIRVERDVKDKTLFVTVPFEDGLGVSDQIHQIVQACEEHIYPVFAKETKTQVELTLEEKKALISRGRSVVEVLSASKTRTQSEKLFLTRVSFGTNHLVLRNQAGTTRYLIKLKYMPLARFLETEVLPGDLSPVELYNRLISYGCEILVMGATNEV